LQLDDAEKVGGADVSHSSVTDSDSGSTNSTQSSHISDDRSTANHCDRPRTTDQQQQLQQQQNSKANTSDDIHPHQHQHQHSVFSYQSSPTAYDDRCQLLTTIPE